MTNAHKNSPMLKAAGLWSKTSVKGGWYLTGRLGGVKVLVMENRDRHSDDDPSHILYFVEGADRRQDVQDRGGGQQASLTTPKPSQPQRNGFKPYGGADNDMPPWER